LSDLTETHGPIDVDFNPDGSSKFTAEIFVNGKSQARCKVWIANQFGEGIAYYEGNDFGSNNALNDILVVLERDGELVLAAQMGSLAFGRIGEGIDLRHLTPSNAAGYLWRRLASHLE
jgi:hypothetical protein